MKNFEMCSGPRMASLVANYMNDIPMGAHIMAAAGLKFVYEEFNPDNICWKRFRNSIRPNFDKNKEKLLETEWFCGWVKQHPETYKEWFGDCVKEEVK